MLETVSEFIGVGAPECITGSAPKTDLTEHLLSEMSASEIAMLEHIVGPTMRAKGYCANRVPSFTQMVKV